MNFCPDIFYRYAFSDKSFFKTLDFAIFDHDSNGVGHASEHAWSRVYLRSSATTRFSNWSFRWEMKMFVYYNNSIADANKDIRKYTGFWNTRISFVNHTSDTEFLDRISMYLEFYPGGTYSTNFKYGAQEIGAKVRLGWGKFNPWLFVQIYHGYCESLIDYNKENFSYRIGIFF